MSPGVTRHEPITLERGITHDTAFEEWARQTWNPSGNPGGEAALTGMRKNIDIDVYNDAGQLALSYRVFRCWPSEYQGLAELDANGEGAAIIESITLVNEGWQRDPAVAPPVTP